ncbi:MULTISPECIES: TIR domain-containing protein [Burkholderiaceae]|nr:MULTISPECIES: TIR domain-containing protein [Burkholderiaceae]AME27055.1 hypothetical protein AXG89_24220 [Burkholderia sp. PAMC 26561]AME27800.1 hypothetical protein AXG89_28470 [Burkholderia sp. PAMC 26561]
MTRRVYFCFDHDDIASARATVVRQHFRSMNGSEAGFFDLATWNNASKSGELAVKNLIDNGLEGTSATCVLIGTATFSQEWVRYEIFRSIARGNRVFGVHINQIPGAGARVKPNGPNPFDFLALKFSDDGTSVEPTEYVGNAWIQFDRYPPYRLSAIAVASRRGHVVQLSDIGCETFSWSNQDSATSMSSWVA